MFKVRTIHILTYLITLEAMKLKITKIRELKDNENISQDLKGKIILHNNFIKMGHQNNNPKQRHI